jgi:hypothetical protein
VLLSSMMRFAGLCTVLALLLCRLPVAAQIISMKQEGNKTITCMRSGLSSNLRNCGSPEWYTYVFVGSISSISSSEQNEKDLQITPEEVFQGQPDSLLKVRTSQAACLPKLAVGDRWLFFLKEQKGSPMVLDYYGNESLPAALAQKRIDTLRQLKTLGDKGLLRGSVKHGRFGDAPPVSGAQVILERIQDN